MGLGDDIIFLAKAEEVYKKTGKKIVPLYHAGLNVLYDNVEFIAKTKDENAGNKTDYNITRYPTCCSTDVSFGVIYAQIKRAIDIHTLTTE